MTATGNKPAAGLKKPAYMLVDKACGLILKIVPTVIEAYQQVDRYPKGEVLVYVVQVEELEQSKILGELPPERRSSMPPKRD